MDVRPSWKDYFMNLVYLVASRSPDEATKVGAVIIRDDWSVISTGYNGFPSGVANTPERQERPNKYFYFHHAEANAVSLAAKHGHALKDCIMFTNGIPCADCARLIIQVGIKKVYVDSEWEDYESLKKWTESCEKSLSMFSEAQVEVIPLDFHPIEIRRFKRGEYF